MRRAAIQWLDEWNCRKAAVREVGSPVARQKQLPLAASSCGHIRWFRWRKSYNEHPLT